MGGAREGLIVEAWDRVVASDPGARRLRMALHAALAMASALGVEFAFATIVGAGAQDTVVAMLLGTIVAMMGSMALVGVAIWPKVRTAVFFPVAIGAGAVGGVATGGHTDLMLVGFVIVMFIAVFVRRFGLPFFFYGFMAWIGYFFAAFLGADMAMLPWMLVCVAVGSCWVLLLSATVLRTRPRRILRRVRDAFDARARAVARACSELLDTAAGADPARARRTLHARQLRLAEAALIIDGWAAEPAALPDGWSAPALRRRVIDAQLAVDALASAAMALATADTAARVPAGRIVDHLARSRYRAAGRAARRLLEPAAAAGEWPAYRLAAATIEFVTLTRRVRTPPDSEPDDGQEFEPAIALALENLPGSPAVAREVDARGGRWNPLSRLSLTTRQSIQVAVAGGLAIIAGRELSSVRYYWAVIAAFVAFAGTATRSETTGKAIGRVAGTVLGLGAGILLAEATTGHTIWTLVVVVTAMSCGFYLVRLSYACMIFFVTIMVAQLYSALHEFTPGLLVLRLEETALGAAIGVVVAFVVLPTSTRDTVASATRTYLTAVGELLVAVAEALDGRWRERPSERAAAEEAQAADEDVPEDEPRAGMDALIRDLDHRLRQVALVARPLTRSLTWSADARAMRHRLSLFAAMTGNARVLATAARRPQSVAAAHALAAVCDPLADTCAALAADPAAAEQPRPDATASLAAAEHLLLGHATQPVPVGAGTRPAPDAATQALTHLHLLLAELAGAGQWEPGAAATDVSEPPSDERPAACAEDAVVPDRRPPRDDERSRA